jgi:hypothetical protein
MEHMTKTQNRLCGNNGKYFFKLILVYYFVYEVQWAGGGMVGGL